MLKYYEKSGVQMQQIIGRILPKRTCDCGKPHGSNQPFVLSPKHRHATTDRPHAHCPDQYAEKSRRSKQVPKTKNILIASKSDNVKCSI